MNSFLRGIGFANIIVGVILFITVCIAQEEMIRGFCIAAYNLFVGFLIVSLYKETK